MYNVFKILWPKYMLYFLYFNKKYKIQYKQSSTTITRPVQCKVTMSCHTKYKVGYCTKRLFAFSRSSCSKCSSVSLLRTKNASDIKPPLMDALNLLLRSVIFRNYFKCKKFKIRLGLHAKMYLKYSSNYKYNKSI